MPLDPTISEQLDAMVSDIKAKEQTLSDASDANTAAQSAAQSAQITAATALQTQKSSREALNTSIQSLVTYLGTL